MHLPTQHGRSYGRSAQILYITSPQLGADGIKHSGFSGIGCRGGPFRPPKGVCGGRSRDATVGTGRCLVSPPGTGSPSQGVHLPRSPRRVPGSPGGEKISGSDAGQCPRAPACDKWARGAVLAAASLCVHSLVPSVTPDTDARRHGGSSGHCRHNQVFERVRALFSPHQVCGVNPPAQPRAHHPKPGVSEARSFPPSERVPRRGDGVGQTLSASF